MKMRVLWVGLFLAAPVPADEADWKAENVGGLVPAEIE